MKVIFFTIIMSGFLAVSTFFFVEFFLSFFRDENVKKEVEEEVEKKVEEEEVEVYSSTNEKK